MSSVNSVLIVGRISNSGDGVIDTGATQMVGFTVVLDETFPGKNGKPGFRKEWVPVKCWGRLAEIVRAAHLLPGTLVAVSGKLRTESWTAQDGAKKYKTVVNADWVNVLAPIENTTVQVDENPDYFGT